MSSYEIIDPFPSVEDFRADLTEFYNEALVIATIMAGVAVVVFFIKKMG